MSQTDRRARLNFRHTLQQIVYAKLLAIAIGYTAKPLPRKARGVAPITTPRQATPPLLAEPTERRAAVHMAAIQPTRACASNGRLKWRFQAGDWINSSPAIGANGALYFGSWDANFYALEARENRNWRTVSKGTESTVNLDNRYWSH